MDIDVLQRAAALARARQPFAVATVVWRRAPSSSHVGSKALIHPDGSADGWLGGACAEPTVVRAGLAAMADGTPRLLFLGRDDELDQRAEDGRVTVPMACDSEGAVEVYLEPVLPVPQLIVIGRTPAVFIITSAAVALGWDVTVIDDGGRPGDHPHPDRVRTTLDLDELGIGAATAVVVATQGHYDDLALDAALTTAAGYVGLVASHKRTASVLELLRGRGVDEASLRRIAAPAGLDLGPVANAEIGIAVLAELIARRAAGGLGVAVAHPPAEPHAVDPVCGMVVDPATSRYRSTREDGTAVYFCAPGCKATFDAGGAHATMRDER
ncbi:MAG: XdhC family protein [Ilumatobacteraceae bacterium]